MRIKSDIVLSFWALWQVATTLLRSEKGAQKALLKEETQTDRVITPSEFDNIARRSAAIYKISKLWPSRIQCAQRSYALWEWLEKRGYHPTMEVGWQDKKAHAWIRIGTVVVNDSQDIAEYWLSLRNDTKNDPTMNKKNEFGMRQVYWKIALDAVRLKLTDFAALIKGLSPDEQVDFVSACSNVGCTRVIAASLQLTRDILQISLPIFAADMISSIDPKRDELAGIWMKMCVPGINDRFSDAAAKRRADYLASPSIKARLRWRLFEMSSPDFPLIKRYPHVHSRLEVIGAKMHRRLFH
jgi:hypothetical protein